MSNVTLKSVVFYEENENPSLKNEKRLKNKFFSDGNGNQEDLGEIYGTENDGDNPHCAVVVRNATMKCGDNLVISGLNMTIRQGIIYSLLGSSGCGKSTTLECILGLNKFTSGNVWVFGKEVGLDKIHGTRIGYMPQDHSLYNELSVYETVTYFGTMNGMEECEITVALNFCTDILDLPKISSRVVNLSGGQKRRVSFAVAVMHNPALVILDEPTVGVDPLVRERIWNHLKHLSKKGSTVIVSTHYTDESRYSDMVGVMRNGSLIVEKSPADLLLEHNTNSLETVVLCLCKAISHQRQMTRTPNTIECSSTTFKPFNSEISEQVKGKSLKERFARTRALVKKNGYLWRRHVGLFMLSVLFPAIGIFLLVKCLDNPKYIHVGVFNEELNVSETCDESSKMWNKTCDVSFWSCKFLSSVGHQEFVLHEYNSSQDAENAVRLGDIWGFIFFPHNFSENLYERANNIRDELDGGNGSNISVFLDRSNAVIAGQITFALSAAYETFLKTILNECDLDPRIGEYALQYKAPIIGKGASYGLFAVPGTIITYMYFWPVITSGIRFVNEKQEGTMKRSIVAGIQLWEVYLSYCVIETIVALLRMVIVYSMASWLLQMEIVGALLPQGILGLLATFMGVGTGLLVGLWCSMELQVALFALGFYAANWLLTGNMWPLEGMSELLKKVGYCLPCTLSGDAMRSMFSHGWELDNVHVWAGFVASIGYILLFFLAAIVISRRKFIN